MYEGRDDYSQLMAEVAHRFDLWDIPTTTISTKQNCMLFAKRRMKVWRYFAEDYVCLFGWLQSFCNT